MTTAPLEFAILSDTHFVPGGGQLYGLNPRSRLEAAVALINADHADVAFVLIAGDLAHWGETGAYEALRDTLATLGPPVLLMMGNHDKRAPFREIFPDAPNDGAGFVQSFRVHDQASLITLDTLDEDGATGITHRGYLCETRLGFLERALSEAPTDRPLILAQHHPCCDLGLPSLDAIRLDNPDAEAAIFARAGRKPDIMLHGHVHRPVFGCWHGIPFHIQRALNHQVAYDPAQTDHIPGSHEGPDLVIARVTDGTIVLHQRPILYEGPVFSMSNPEAIAGRISGA
ncbi:MAG: phosphodiesterase [Pseudomonadota bacterium]